MNIIVFENEYQNVKTAFDATNLIHFNKSLNITNYVSSQECPSFQLIDKNSCIFVDIDLSSKSNMDGFEVIEKLLEAGIPKKHLLILTGHISIDEKARLRGLDEIAIITKPIDFKVLYEALSKHQSLLNNP